MGQLQSDLKSIRVYLETPKRKKEWRNTGEMPGGAFVCRSLNPYDCCGDGPSSQTLATDGGRRRETTRWEFQSKWRPPFTFPWKSQTREPLFSLRARLPPHVVGGRWRGKAGRNCWVVKNLMIALIPSLFPASLSRFIPLKFFLFLVLPSSFSTPPVSPSHLSARSAAKGKPSQVQSN